VTCSVSAFFLDDPVTAGRIAAKCLDRVEGLGFHQAEAMARVIRGWSRACAGDVAGTEDAKKGIELFISSGARVGIVQYHFVAAEAFVRAGDLGSAARCVNDAATWIVKTGGSAAFEPRVPMYRAEILLESDSLELERAKELILEACAGMHPYASPWLELRAAITLARIGLLGVEPVLALENLTQAIAALPGCEGEPRVRLARNLLEGLEAG
jgi:hypothetical protein